MALEDPYEEDFPYPPPPNPLPQQGDGGGNAPGGPPGQPAPPEVIPGGGGHGGGGGGWTEPAYPVFNFPGAPAFRPTPFTAPTLEDARNEPGYQFRLGSGVNALEASAAARGRLLTGGTLTDVNTYGQRFGESEFKNVYDRAMQAHNARYRGEYDAFAPQMARYNAQLQGERDARLAQYSGQWQRAMRPPGGGGGGGEIDLNGLLGPEPMPPGFQGGPQDYEGYGDEDPLEYY